MAQAQVNWMSELAFVGQERGYVAEIGGKKYIFPSHATARRPQLKICNDLQNPMEIQWSILQFDIALGSPNFLSNLEELNRELLAQGKPSYIPAVLDKGIVRIEVPTNDPAKPIEAQYRECKLNIGAWETLQFLLDQKTTQAMMVGIQTLQFVPPALLEVYLNHQKMGIPISMPPPIEIIRIIPNQLKVHRPPGFPTGIRLDFFYSQASADQSRMMRQTLDGNTIEILGLTKDAVKYQVEYVPFMGYRNVVRGTFSDWPINGIGNLDLPIEAKLVVVRPKLFQAFNATRLVLFLFDQDQWARCALFLDAEGHSVQQHIVLQQGVPIQYGILLGFNDEHALTKIASIGNTQFDGPDLVLFLPTDQSLALKKYMYTQLQKRMMWALSMQNLDSTLAQYFSMRLLYEVFEQHIHAATNTEFMQWYEAHNRITLDYLRTSYAGLSAGCLMEWYVQQQAESKALTELENLAPSLSQSTEDAKQLREALLQRAEELWKSKTMPQLKAKINAMLIQCREWLQDNQKARLWAITPILKIPEYMTLGDALWICHEQHELELAEGKFEWTQRPGSWPSRLVIHGAGPEKTQIIFWNTLDLTDIHVEFSNIKFGIESLSLPIVLSHVTGTFSNCLIQKSMQYGLEIKHRSILEFKNSSIIRNQAGILVDGSGTELTLINCTVSENEGDGVDIRSNGYVTLKKCQIQRNQYNGILLFGAKADIAENQIIGNKRNGISLLQKSQASISLNRIQSNSEHGVYLHGSTATIQENKLLDNLGYGIAASNAYNVLIQANLCQGNHKSGIGIYDQSTAHVRQNRVVANHEYGIQIHQPQIADVLLDSNECTDNQWQDIKKT